MPSDIPTLALRRLEESGCLGSRLEIQWHAGEPTALPIAYYEEIFQRIDACKPAGLSIRHSFQTNGTLLSSDWCHFFRDWGVAVGVSIDGPQNIHDAVRRGRSKRGTHRDVVRAIQTLQRYGVPFSVIAVLTRNSLDSPDELFAFFRDNGIVRVAFNHEEIEGCHKSSSLSCDDAELVLRFFLVRYIQLLKVSMGVQRVREIDDRLELLLSGRTLEGAVNTPLKIVSVNYRGDMSTFSPELLGMTDGDGGNFLFGNLRTSRIEEMIRSDKFDRAYARIRLGVAECQRVCGYYAVCGGGSPSNKLAENGDFASTETMYCRLGVKAITDVLLELIDEGLRVPGTV